MADRSGLVAADRSETRRAIAGLALPMTIADVVLFVEIIGVVALLGRVSNEALYIRSLTMPILLLFVAMSTAFAITYQVMASISRGRERPEDLVPTAVALLRVFVVTGFVLCLLLYLGSPALGALLDVPAAERAEFVRFLRWTSLASLTVVLPALCSAALRGFGHARAAAVVTLTSAAVEFALVGLLGFGAGLGLFSVPIATAVASAAAAVPGLWFMRRHRLWGRLTGVPVRGEVTGFLRGVGLPVALSYVLISLFNVGMLWVLTPFGPDTISGYAAASTLQALIIIPGIQLGGATAIVINQRRGAGSVDRAGEILRAGLELTFAFYAVVAAVIWLLRDMVGRIVSDDPRVVAAVGLYIGVVALTYLAQGPVLASLTFLEHIGNGTLALLLNVIYFAEIVVIGGVLARALDDPAALYATAAVGNVVGLVVVVIAVRRVRRMRPVATVEAPLAGGPR